MSIKDIVSTAMAELASAREQLIACYGGVSPPIVKFIAATTATIEALGAWEAKYGSLRVGQALVSDEVFHQRAVVESFIQDKASTLTRQWRIERCGAGGTSTILFRMRINQGAWLHDWREAPLDLMALVTRIIPAPDVEP